MKEMEKRKVVKKGIRVTRDHRKRILESGKWSRWKISYTGLEK